MTATSRRYTPHDTMRRLIEDNTNLLPAISRFGIAFGFGDKSVEQVCQENNVDTGTLLSVCNLISGHGASVSDVSLPALMQYLRRAHISFLDITLPRIRQYLIEAVNHTRSNAAALMLINFFDDYVAEVNAHMKHEDTEIFGYVDKLLAGERRPDFGILHYEADHSDMSQKLNDLKDIFIYHYDEPDTARLSAALFDIVACERDLMSHFEVEQRLLVPAVERLEAQLEPKAASPQKPSQTAVLSEREKDIIRCVARGLSNKEIADTLCISQHTVATHRRNVSAKLDIHSSAALAVYAILHGLIDVHEIK